MTRYYSLIFFMSQIGRRWSHAHGRPPCFVGISNLWSSHASSISCSTFQHAVPCQKRLRRGIRRTADWGRSSFFYTNQILNTELYTNMMVCPLPPPKQNKNKLKNNKKCKYSSSLCLLFFSWSCMVKRLWYMIYNLAMISINYFMPGINLHFVCNYQEISGKCSHWRSILFPLFLCIECCAEPSRTAYVWCYQPDSEQQWCTSPCRPGDHWILGKGHCHQADGL